MISLICVNGLTRPYRPLVILWEELGGELQTAFCTPHHLAWGDSVLRDASTAIERTAPGLEATPASAEPLPMTVFTANPLLNTQLYNYNLLQLCKEETLQKGLLISHS